MDNYTFQKLEKSGFESLIPLMKDCFGMDVNIDYFKWKYLDNPAGEFIGFIAVSPANEIAAYYGVIPELYSIEGKERTIYQSCDTMTHSAHRRKGLFQSLAKICYRYLEENGKLFIIGFGGAQSTPGFLKFGWVKCFDIQYYFFPRLFYKLQKLFFLRDKKNDCVPVNDLSQIKQLLYKSNAGGPIHSVKTEHIYKWRIANPTYQYKLIACLHEKGNFTGYACYYFSGDKIFLFDHYFENAHARKTIMKYLKQKLAEDKMKGIVGFCQQKSRFSKSLKKAGFISNPFKKGPLSEKTPFIFYATKEAIARFNDPGKWLINSFDHDAI
jgi:GNAT superfamily N-acetyltransferase